MRARMRGIFGMAVTWGVALATVSATVFVAGLAVRLLPSSVFTPGVVMAAVLRNFVAGTFIGGMFAFLLSSTERRHTLDSLPTRRVALWGAIAAAPVMFIAAAFSPVMLPAAVVLAGGVGFTAIGSALAVTTVGIARRAERGNTLGAPRPLRDLPHGAL